MHKTFLRTIAILLVAGCCCPVRAFDSTILVVAPGPLPGATTPLPTTVEPPFELPPVPVERDLDKVMTNSAILREVSFRGNRTIPSAELVQVAQPWLGKPVSEADLETLRHELTRYYIERGFINSGARLPAGVLPSDAGEITYEIVEGRLGEIAVRGLQGLDPSYLIGKLTPDPDAILNVDVLRENFQMLLEDPLFDRVSAQLAPGRHPGNARLNLDIQRFRPYRIEAFVNNYRSPTVGEVVWGMAGSVRNLTGRGDTLEGRIQKSFEGDRDHRTVVSWRIPLSFTGTTFSVHIDDGASLVIEEPLHTINVGNRLSTLEAHLEHSLLAGLHRRLLLGFGYQSRIGRTYVDGDPFSFTAGETDGVTRAHTLKFWQEYILRSEQQVLALRSTFSKTSNNLERIAGLPSHDQPASEYLNWLGQAQYLHRIDATGKQFGVRLLVQHASRNMLSMDGLSIGGVGSVRGYRENLMVRDTGLVVNFELDIPLRKALPTSDQSLDMIPFVDYARGKNIGGTSQYVASAGMALRWRISGVSVDLALARHLKHSTDLGLSKGALQDAGVHLQIAYKL